MTLKFYNTLTRKKQVFKPLKSKQVGIYSCGPTVYNYAHIGNLRTYIFNDLLKKSLEFLGYKVTHVMNITDVDDKTITASKKQGVSLKKFTREYEKIFFNDLKSLNIKKPTHIPRATESIKDMIKLIQVLLKKGYAYKSDDGIYFSIKKFKSYGKLAKLQKIKKSKSRIANDSYDKENAKDFALWKFHTQEDGDNFWKAGFGKGRPGWHIECSAMSMKKLGETFDIHTGASDLIFPHHTNEIAQSQAATGKQFVKYWLHAGFLTMKQGKMSKSLGNILRLKDLRQKGFSALDYRYLTLTTHYREQLRFSLENLNASKIALQRLKNIILTIKNDKKINNKYLAQFTEALKDDLNTPKALAILWKLVRDPDAEGKLKAIKKIDEIFSLDLLKNEKTKIPQKIKKLVDERERARKNKDWKTADSIREKINEFGFQVDDTGRGAKISKK